MPKVWNTGGIEAEVWGKLALWAGKAVRHSLELASVGIVSLEDVLEETYLEAWRQRGRFRGHSRKEFLAWFAFIAKYKAANFRRREIRRARFAVSAWNTEADEDPQEPFSRDPSPEEIFHAQERRERIDMALATLAGPSARLVKAVYLRGIPLCQAAESLGLGQVAARKRLSRALRQMRRCIGKMQGKDLL